MIRLVGRQLLLRSACVAVAATLALGACTSSSSDSSDSTDSSTAATSESTASSDSSDSGAVGTDDVATTDASGDTVGGTTANGEPLATVGPLPTSPPPSTIVGAPACIDFLAEFEVKITATYLGCVPEQTGPAAVLRALYSVEGKDAPTVEKTLAKEFAMPEMQFNGFTWDTLPKEPGTKTPKDGFARKVSMRSEQTKIGERAKLANVPKFFVTVEVNISAK